MIADKECIEHSDKNCPIAAMADPSKGECLNEASNKNMQRQNRTNKAITCVGMNDLGGTKFHTLIASGYGGLQNRMAQESVTYICTVMAVVQRWLPGPKTDWKRS